MQCFGYTGNILRVDLTSGTIDTEKPDESYYRNYLGGRGIIAHTLLTEIPAQADPLGPDNKVVFAAGLLTGNKIIGSGRCSVGAKSPLTGGFGESEAGGMWGVELRRADYDAVIIEGVSPKPVYLWIHDDAVEIRDVEAIWGSDVKTSMAWVRQDTGQNKARTALIGPGGENRVRFGNIIVDCCDAFGRSGMGAVLGSKRLKGVVVKGSHRSKSANNEGVLDLNRIMKDRYKSSPFEKYGTGAVMTNFETVGNLPIRNYSGGRFPDVAKIDAVTLMRDYGTGMGGCFNCPIRCKKKIRIENAPWPVDPVYGGPEYETLASFGSNLLIDDLPAICKAGELCDSYGIDTISTGATIAFAMECYEKGILTVQDLDGVQLNFGNSAAMLVMVEKIARREGIGDLLARGSRIAAEEIGNGATQYAIQVKGLELPYHEPRLNQGLGLHYSVHAVGADHCTGVIDGTLPGLLDNWKRIGPAENIPATELSPRKVRMAYELGLYREMSNHLGLCYFVPWNISELKGAVSAVTGWSVTTWNLMKAVERGITMMRLFNLREGFTFKDDILPARFNTSPADGPLKGERVNAETHREARELYYRMMGWDSKGIPTDACLAALDLEWAATDLPD